MTSSWASIATPVGRAITALRRRDLDRCRAFVPPRYDNCRSSRADRIRALQLSVVRAHEARNAARGRGARRGRSDGVDVVLPSPPPGRQPVWHCIPCSHTIDAGLAWRVPIAGRGTGISLSPPVNPWLRRRPRLHALYLRLAEHFWLVRSLATRARAAVPDGVK